MEFRLVILQFIAKKAISSDQLYQEKRARRQSKITVVISAVLINVILTYHVFYLIKAFDKSAFFLKEKVNDFRTGAY